MRPLAIGEKPGSTPKDPPPTIVMKLLTRLHPELRRSRQDHGPSVRRKKLAPRGRPVVRPRPRRADREESGDPGRRRRVTRRWRPPRAPRRRAVTLRSVGAPEPRDPRRRPRPVRRPPRTLRGLGHRRQRRYVAPGRQLPGHGGNRSDAAAGRRRDTTAGPHRRLARHDRRGSIVVCWRSGCSRRLAREPSVAHRQQRRHRPPHSRRSSRPAVVRTAQRHRRARHRTRHRRNSLTRPGPTPRSVRRARRRSTVRSPPTRGHSWTLLELASWSRPTAPCSKSATGSSPGPYPSTASTSWSASR